MLFGSNSLVVMSVYFPVSGATLRQMNLQVKSRAGNRGCAHENIPKSSVVGGACDGMRPHLSHWKNKIIEGNLNVESH